MIKRHFLQLALLLIVFPLLPSCVKEEFNGKQGTEGIETEVSISISVPCPSMITTRSLTKDNEETINTIQLLVFNTSGKYLYTSNGSDIRVDANDRDVRNFSAVLKTGTVDIVALANCRDLLSNCFPSGIGENTDKQIIIDQLTLAITDKWVTDTSDNDYLDMPMWGAIGTCIIFPTTTQIGNAPYDIHRMLARVDVTTSLSAATDFKLTSVRLYYYNDTGSVIPDASDFGSDTPSIPANATRVKGPVIYEGAAIADDANGNPACIREIYLFEAAAGNRFTHPENTCLVVGGEYKGIAGFYRIDFQQTTSSGKKYLDILRNHNYQVIITSVEDVGFKDPEEALEAFPVNINSQVIDWVENSSDDISIGDNYILKLSTDELVFSPNSGTQYMYVYTNHPEGWKFVKDNFVPEVDWLTITPVKGIQGNFTEVKVTVDENTDTGMRIDEIPILVDNVSKQILFAQRGTGDVDLEVFATPNPILIGKFPTEPITINVSTYPADIPLYFNYTGDIEWENGGFPTDGTTDRILQLQPKANATDNVLTGFLTIYVKDAGGHTASCVVEIQQITKIAGLEATLETIYPATPGEYSFKVKSTVPWRVNYVSDAAAWIPSFGSSDQDPAGIQEMKFQLAGNPFYEKREIVVSLYCPTTGEYETLTFVQDFMAPQIIGEKTIVLPTETGQKVIHKFYANADWTLAAATTSNNWIRAHCSLTSATSGTGRAYEMKEYTIELETNDIPSTGSTAPFAGPFTGSNAIIVTLRNHSPATGTYSFSFDLSRQIPIVVTAGTSLAYKSKYHRMQSSTSRTGISNESKYMYRIPSGEHIIIWMYIYHNMQKFTAWSEFDPSNKYTKQEYSYPPTGASILLNPNFLITANPDINTREAKIYMEPTLSDGSIGDLYELLLEQDGTEGITVNINSHIGTTIPTGGDKVTFTINDPNGILNTNRRVFVTFTVDDNLVNMGMDEWFGHAVWYGSYAAGGTYTFPLEPHDGTTARTREVKLLYGIQLSSLTSMTLSDAYKLGTSFHTAPQILKQDYQIHQLNSGYKIARGNVRDNSTYGFYGQAFTNWVTALGIEDNYLNQNFFSNSSQFYTYTTRNDLSDDAFSCATHTEPDYPNMKWRVPTLDELQEMYNKRGTIGGFFPGSLSTSTNYYRAVNESGTSNTYIWDFATGTSMVMAKTTTSPRIRCVSRTTN